MKFIFQRHGDTNKPEEGAHDRTRTLKDEGVRQAVSFGQKTGPIDLVFSSGVARSNRTAEITARAASGKDRIDVIKIEDLYPVDKFPHMDKAFAELGYAPLSKYLLIEEVAQEMSGYAELGIALIFNKILQHQDKNVTALVTSHAICTNILALELSKDYKFSKTQLDLILETSMAAGAGFMIEVGAIGEPVEVAYITP